MPIEIEINAEVLKSADSRKKDKAGQIIDQTTKVMINGTKPIDVAPKNKKIAVKVTTDPDLGVGPWIIALMNEKGETLIELGYDPERQKFPPQEEATTKSPES